MRLCSPVGAFWCSRILWTRFASIFRQISHEFGNFRLDLKLFFHVRRRVFVTLSWPKKLVIDRLTHSQKSSSPTLGIKSAITRTTHPQHSFSKGGGFAKRPQLSSSALFATSTLYIFQSITEGRDKHINV